MKYYHSTRNSSISVNGAQAVLQGIAPDGGLYVPENFEKLDLEELFSLDAYGLFARVLCALLGGWTEQEMRETVVKGYQGRFETEEVTPLVTGRGCPHFGIVPRADLRLQGRGPFPSAASYHPGGPGGRRACGARFVILTATSGDTGKAALDGLLRTCRARRIAVFYPARRSQRSAAARQMVTQRGQERPGLRCSGQFRRRADRREGHLRQRRAEGAAEGTICAAFQRQFH